LLNFKTIEVITGLSKFNNKTQISTTTNLPNFSIIHKQN